MAKFKKKIVSWKEENKGNFEDPNWLEMVSKMNEPKHPQWYLDYLEEVKVRLPRVRVVCPICDKLLEIKEDVWGQIRYKMCEECAKDIVF